MLNGGKFQKWSLQILIILTIILIASKVSFLLEPVGIFFTTLFFPILISGFLFFIFNPVVKFFERKLKLKRTLSIILLYIIILTAIIVGIGNVIPIISKQITSFANDIPKYASQIEHFINENSDELQNIISNEYVPFEKVEEKLNEFLNTLPTKITNAFFGVFGFLTSTVVTIITVPVLLFYMFKDGHRLPIAFSKFIPRNYRKEGLETIEDVGETLSAYINGQVTVACIVGLLAFIGYLIIDVPYPLVMALIVAVTNIIPYVGPILGGAPAVIIALFDSPFQALLVVIVITIAQQIEGNFLSPLILGKSLDIHPATVIILLLVAGNIAGVIGMVLAVPAYAVTKTIVISIARFLEIRRQANNVIPKDT